jgi:hypothetical protein
MRRRWKPSGSSPVTERTDILGFGAKVSRIEEDDAIFGQIIDIHSLIERAAD